MSAAVSHTTVQTESKTAKKRKSKVPASGTSSSVASTTPTAENGLNTASVTSYDGVNGVEGKFYETPYIKELYKSIRNITKKINATSKVDSVLAENPGKTLDELVADRKINNDQKAQALKKPSLVASLNQLEDQIVQYKQFDQEHQALLTSEKEALRKQHEAELQAIVEKTKEEAKAEAQIEQKRNLLLLSRFLRLAAAKRQESEGQPDTAEKRALEGLLLLVYGGDETAVTAIDKLIRGSDDRVYNMSQEPEEYTYAQVKQAAFEPFESVAEETAHVESQAYPSPPSTNDAKPLVESDPTILHAGLNELDATPVSADNLIDTGAAAAGIEQATIGVGSANAVAESHWDTKMSASGEGPDGWLEVVAVPRDLGESDAGLSTAPAANSGTQSWADDNPVTTPPPSTAASLNQINGTVAPNDGFHEVHHSRGGRGRGGSYSEHRGYRGRGGYRGGDGYRGRGGFRGDRGGGEGGYRGRGRGGFKNHRGREADAPRRPEES
ncbi:MAG: hypothetical protein M1825_005485 [Sarcosagium campestre]|nr:MAG: hypothetical protein M1825_005485 [Sarcosagium campestre]